LIFHLLFSDDTLFLGLGRVFGLFEMYFTAIQGNVLPHN